VSILDLIACRHFPEWFAVSCFGLILLGWVVDVLVLRRRPKTLLPPAPPGEVVTKTYVDEVAREQAAATPAVGVRYEPGGPTPVLKPRRQPIFDTLIVPDYGEVETGLFLDCRTFPDGTHKVYGRDTNMTQHGHLGTPLIYDILSWTLNFEEWGHPEDVRKVLAGLQLAFHLGFSGDPPRCVAPGSQFVPIIGITNGKQLLDLYTTQPIPGQLAGYSDERWKEIKAAVVERVDECVRTGLWRHYYMGLASPKAIRLESTDGFFVRATCRAGKLAGPVRLKVSFRGTMYAP